MSGWVYFISDGTATKVGWSEIEPRLRMAQLQTGNPRLLVLLVALDARRGDEARVHRALAHARGIGEWFGARDPIVLELFALAQANVSGFWARVDELQDNDGVPMVAESFGRRLRELRVRGGLSHADLAKRAGVSRGLISHYETGRVVEAAPRTAGRLAVALGVTPAFLVFGGAHA